VAFHWPLREDSGIALDIGPYSRHATLESGAIRTVAHPVNLKKSVNFQGGSLATAPLHWAMQLSGASFTVTFWARFNQLGPTVFLGISDSKGHHPKWIVGCAIPQQSDDVQSIQFHVN